MTWSRLRRALVPQSLRRQLMLAVTAVALLIAAGGITAVYALRLAATSTRQLAEERLQRMHQAQHLVQQTLLIERQSLMLVSTVSSDDRRMRLSELASELTAFDHLADQFASAEHDPIVLDLRKYSQMFRNTANVVAQVGEADDLDREPPRVTGSPLLPHHSASAQSVSSSLLAEELRRLASRMVAAAQQQSDHYTDDYQNAVLELAASSSRNERWVTLFLAGSLLLSWLIAQKFLGGHVFARLQLISHGLRRRDASEPPAVLAVQGHDEIAEMARAVERFQEDSRKLALRTAELEAANLELQELSYAISHELRTPLRALDGFSKLLQDKHGESIDDDSKRMLQVLRDNAQRQGRLVDDILRFLALGRQRLDHRLLDVGALATELFAELQAAMPQRPMQIKVSTTPPAWADRAMLRQALQNLLSNAVRFTPTDREAVIEVSGETGDGEDVFHVRDHGAGFDIRYAHKLFRVFERIHSSGEHGGTGMGLAIVKRVIDRHGGRVWAESNNGEGATFHFTLPRQPAESGRDA